MAAAATTFPTQLMQATPKGADEIIDKYTNQLDQEQITRRRPLKMATLAKDVGLGDAYDGIKQTLLEVVHPTSWSLFTAEAGPERFPEVSEIFYVYGALHYTMVLAEFLRTSGSGGSGTGHRPRPSPSRPNGLVLHSMPNRGIVYAMDPVEALSGEPRTKGANAATAPGAAQWLNNPTQHDNSPEPGSPDWWRAVLLAWGKALAREDAKKWKRNDPCNHRKS